MPSSDWRLGPIVLRRFSRLEADQRQNCQVWRTDTGMSSGMMCGPLECLEILRDGTVTILTKNGPVPADDRRPKAVGTFEDVCDLGTGICASRGDEPAANVGSTESLADLIRSSRKVESRAGALRAAMRDS